MTIDDDLTLLDNILDKFRTDLGPDYPGYRNHLYRVVNLCGEIHGADQTDRDKIIIAACFHDLGIWTNHTFDYLAPSVVLAQQYLEENSQDEWFKEIKMMIMNHHKITSVRGSELSLVESFRQADWIDVTKGVRSFGLPRKTIKRVLGHFPNAGFHKKLLQLSLEQLRKKPLNPAPMMRW